MSVTQSIDDKIHGIKPKDFEPVEIKKAPEQEEKETLRQEDREVEQEAEERKDEGKDETQTEKDSHKSEPVASDTKETSDDTHEVDEYGTKVEKEKLYTRAEVEQRIRERLARGNHQQQLAPQQVQQVQQATDNFKADPNSSEDWETQLASFVRHEIDKVSKESQTREYQRQQQAKQAEFESKFTTGMDRYKDFKEVVGEMPITDSMMMATREMKDPAAFLYAATKTQPDEVRRIAALSDPFHQAAEIGRLEEKMRKARNISKTAKPLTQTKGDMGTTYVPRQSLDDKIIKHAKSKRR